MTKTMLRKSAVNTWHDIRSALDLRGEKGSYQRQVSEFFSECGDDFKRLWKIFKDKHRNSQKIEKIQQIFISAPVVIFCLFLSAASLHIPIEILRRMARELEMC